MNLEALYLVKLIFGKYFCYFDSNLVAVSLQLQLYLDANLIPVCEKVNVPNILNNTVHLVVYSIEDSC